MKCSDCRALLDAYLDGELSREERAEVDAHLAECAECSASLASLGEISRTLKEGLVRHPAPDVLKARIRGALAESGDATVPRVRGHRIQWASVAAALILAAATGSIAFVGARQMDEHTMVANEVLSSHLRSLTPGHLTDVASNDQHNVKPWFNGRIDMSPTVPRLDSLGFPLLGGRVDYVAGRQTAAVVYGRRQHLINVFSWPERGGDENVSTTAEQGYHLVYWRENGIELWVVSDVNLAELEQFVADFRRAR